MKTKFLLITSLFLFSLVFNVLHAQVTGSQAVNDVIAFMNAPFTTGNTKNVDCVISVTQKELIKTASALLVKESSSTVGNTAAQATQKAVYFTQTSTTTPAPQKATIVLKPTATSLGTIELASANALNPSATETITLPLTLSAVVIDNTIPKKYIIFGQVGGTKGDKVVTITLSPREFQVN